MKKVFIGALVGAAVPLGIVALVQGIDCLVDFLRTSGLSDNIIAIGFLSLIFASLGAVLALQVQK